MAITQEQALEDSIDIKAGPFSGKLTGRDSMMIFIVILLLALAGLTLWEHAMRANESKEIMCAIKLNLFMQTTTRGTPIEWDKMPVDLYPCIPRFLYDRGGGVTR